MTCRHCQAGHPLSFGAHFRYADRTWIPVGVCTADPNEKPEATADRALEKIRAMKDRAAAASVLSSLPRPVESRPVPLPHNEVAEREPGEEGRC